MTIRLPTASLLLPLLIASPMLSFGPYGFSLAEVLVVATGLFHVARLGFNVSIPPFILFYCLLLTVGRVTSLMNAPRFGVPVGLERLSFLYLLVLPILAYLVGRRSNRTMEAVSTSGMMQVVLVFVAVLAAAFPFLEADVKLAALYWFVPEQFLTLERHAKERFPGLGINSNLYAFMLCIILLFAFRAFLAAKAPLRVAVFAFVAIVSSSGRLAIVLALGGCLALWGSTWLASRRARGARTGRLIAYAAVVATVALAASFFFRERVEELLPKIVVLERFRELVSPDERIPVEFQQPSAVEERLIHWRLGMQRVALAPVMGIAPNLWVNSDTDVVLFSAPHNEFIFYWTAYGLFGLFAVVFLVFYLLFTNVIRRTGLVWVLVYGTLIAQMTFDGAFQSVRFVAFFFIIVGLNVTEWIAAGPAHARAAVRSAPG